MKIDIKVGDGKSPFTRTTDAELVGPLAVHHSIKYRTRWLITHVASGRVLMKQTICCRAHAIEIAKTLTDSGIDWNFGELPSVPGQRRAQPPVDRIAEMQRAGQIVSRTYILLSNLCEVAKVQKKEATN